LPLGKSLGLFLHRCPYAEEQLRELLKAQVTELTEKGSQKKADTPAPDCLPVEEVPGAERQQDHSVQESG